MAGKLLMVDAVTLFKSKGLKKSLAAIDPAQRGNVVHLLPFPATSA